MGCLGRPKLNSCFLLVVRILNKLCSQCTQRKSIINRKSFLAKLASYHRTLTVHFTHVSLPYRVFTTPVSLMTYRKIQNAMTRTRGLCWMERSVNCLLYFGYQASYRSHQNGQRASCSMLEKGAMTWLFPWKHKERNHRGSKLLCLVQQEWSMKKSQQRNTTLQTNIQLFNKIVGRSLALFYKLFGQTEYDYSVPNKIILCRIKLFCAE